MKRTYRRSCPCSAGQKKKPNNTINTDSKHARAFGTRMFAAGYGGR
jgi:hypothetical protein